jgi:hypothetical protein
MTTFSRLLVRTAARIQAHYLETPRPLPPLPDFAWAECQRLTRLVRHAQRFGWTTTARRLEPSLQRALGRLTDELGQITGQFTTHPAPIVPSLRELYDELVAIHEEFEHVRIELRHSLLIVQTDPIVLDDVDLGRFEIRLQWDRLQRASPYWIRALDPRPAAVDASLYHPHVRDEVLCEGEGKQAIRNTLARGYLSEFFLVVARILETYNGGSAYASLANWEGRLCTDCGDVADEEGCRECSRCHDLLCSDCSQTCVGCDRDFCGECIGRCEGCEERCCNGCLSSCSACEGHYCDECLSDGLCEICTAEAADTETATESADAAGPAALASAAAV